MNTIITQTLTETQTDDDGHRDEADEPPQPQHTGDEQQYTGGKAREEHALQPMRRHDADEHGAHSAGRAGDLERRAAEQRDHDTGDDGRNKARRGGSAGRNAERERERQRHGAHRETGENILHQLRGVIAGKLSLYSGKKRRKHDDSSPKKTYLPTIRPKPPIRNRKNKHSVLF